MGKMSRIHTTDWGFDNLNCLCVGILSKKLLLKLLRQD